MSDIERIKLIIDLTLAKVEILKLKADHYNWSCHVDGKTREELMETLEKINLLLNCKEIKNE